MVLALCRQQRLLANIETDCRVRRCRLSTHHSATVCVERPLLARYHTITGVLRTLGRIRRRWPEAVRVAVRWHPAAADLVTAGLPTGGGVAVNELRNTCAIRDNP